MPCWVFTASIVYTKVIDIPRCPGTYWSLYRHGSGDGWAWIHRGICTSVGHKKSVSALPRNLSHKRLHIFLLVWDQRLSSCFWWFYSIHLWCMLGSSVWIWMKSNLFWFVEVQTHLSTSWHAIMSLTRNQPIEIVLCANLHTTSKHALQTLPNMEGVICKITNSWPEVMLS